MAKASQPQLTVAEAAEQITPEDVDQQLLIQTARAIYLEMSKGEMRGRNPKLIAQVAYARAMDFVLVTQAVQAGATIPDERETLQPLWCKVRLWDGSKGLHGEPAADELGQPVFEVQPVDRDAFAPNLPKDHPVNQRYYPNALAAGILCNRDGTPLVAAN